MPAAAVETVNGEPLELTKLIGSKPVLVEFWATWCGVCKAQKPRLEAAHNKYRDRVQFVVVAVSVSQTLQAVLDYLKEQGLPGRVVYDSKGEAMASCGLAGTGYIFLVNAEGRIAYAGVGPMAEASVPTSLREFRS